MTASAAKTVVPTKEDLAPAKVITSHYNLNGVDGSYITLKGLTNAKAGHIIDGALADAAGKLIEMHEKELKRGLCTMKITPEVQYNNNGIISVTYTSEGQVRGAAHGFKNMSSVNYNYLTGEELTVKELNKLDAMAKSPKYSLKNINGMLKDAADAGSITLLNKAKKLPPFFITGDKMDVVAFFQPMEVAPYAEGIVCIKAN